ncbi:MAG: hexitol phosphatase HxpB [Chitinophagaceae bacterium]
MLNTVIFDMDGLLIDSEPHWQQAGMEALEQFGIELTLDQYRTSTGLRTPEWLEYWFNHFNIDNKHSISTIKRIEDKAIELIQKNGIPFPGTNYILHFFKERNFKIGLATSSPLQLIEVVVEKLGIRNLFDTFSSAEGLPLGKPHPQVYINCAAQMDVSPLECICFEDSFNGIRSAKASRMYCVAVPEPIQFDHKKWGAADIKIAELMDFNESHLDQLGWS